MGYIIKPPTGGGGLITESGTWTPVFSSESGNINGPISFRAFYSRVGDIVNCSIYGRINFNIFTLLNGSFITTFPITTTTPNAIGEANYIQYFNGSPGAVIDNRIYLSVINTLPSTGTYNFVASFQYEIN